MNGPAGKKTLWYCPKTRSYRAQDGMQIGRDYPCGIKHGPYWVLRDAHDEVLAWSAYAENLAEAYGLELLL